MDEQEYFYDQDSTIFSPDGRLFQVEYAREVINKGSTTIGLKTKDGCILIAFKDDISKLIERNGSEKITKIDDHIGVTFSGLTADAYRLIEIAREEAQIYRMTYGEKIPVKTLIENICEFKHLHTQFEWIRPFGVTLIFAGIDEKGYHLYATDPSGAYLGYKLICEGKKSNNLTSYFQKNYSDNLTSNEAIEVCLNAIKKIISKKIEKNSIEIAMVSKEKNYQKIVLNKS